MNAFSIKEPNKGSPKLNNSTADGVSAKESQLTLGILEAIEQTEDISQRHLAQKMGVALGLANSYLKRCVKKGWVKMATAPANRYMYYLTPNGFAEKARLTAEFLSTSLALFKQSGDEYTRIFEECSTTALNRVLLVGLSDLTEIALMRSLQCNVTVVAIYQPSATRNEFFGVPVLTKLIECRTLASDIDVVVLSSMEQTVELLAELDTVFNKKAVKTPELLKSMNYRNETGS